MIRVLVIDDTILYRKLVSDIASSVTDVRVVGTAPNGKIGLSRIYALKPDLVTLDVEMPEMNGIEVLEASRGKGLDTAFLMVSALTSRGADLALQALELGAFDVLGKPDGELLKREDFERELRLKIDGFARRREISTLLRGGSITRADPPPRPLPPAVPRAPTRVARPRSRPEIVGIGVSTGGPAALLELVPGLPATLGIPVLIAQHMPPKFTESLAKSLAARSALAVKEAENGETLRPGTVYLAPGGSHLRVDLGADATTKILRVTQDPPENHCRPSVDYLFRSLARHFYGRALALVMTGMGEDGAAGAAEIARSGGSVIVQDEASSTVWGMPKATLDRGVVEEVLPLGRLAGAIVRRMS